MNILAALVIEHLVLGRVHGLGRSVLSVQILFQQWGRDVPGQSFDDFSAKLGALSPKTGGFDTNQYPV